MTITSPYTVDAATAAANRNIVANTTSTTGQNTLDQSAYLKLMTAQLQYQDPFAPMDNTQMVAQMAQFSQLAGQNTTNTTLQSIADAVGAGSRLSEASNWIGKSMLVKSSTVAPDAAGQYMGQLTTTADSDALSVDLVDSAGSVVKTVDLGAQKAGDVPFYWDGKDADGNATTGQLSIRVHGSAVSQTAAWTTIAAVQSPASGADAKLITTLGNFVPSDALTLA